MKASSRLRILLLCVASWLQMSYAWTLDCTFGHSTFVRRQFVRLDPESIPAAEVVHVHESPPSECFGLCSSDRNCSAYFVDHGNRSCLLVRDADVRERHLVPDGSISFHRKVCLPASTCKHEWLFDELQGVQLFHYDDKTVSNVTSGDACMAFCLMEPSFVCRSARFDASESACVLSRHDRRSAADFFRQSPKPDSVLYLERQCVKEPNGCLFRSRQSRATLRFHRHAQVVDSVVTREDCEMACLYAAPFPCRSYTYSKGRFPAEQPLCLLSPEDSSSNVGPPVVVPTATTGEQATKQLGDYYEKESCIDVDVKCEASAMNVVVRVSTPFRGRVYAAGHPYECYSVSVADGGRVELTIPLHGRKCGTRNLGNGTFINSVVVQHHPFVLRTTDRRIDVACDYEEMTLKIRGSKAVSHGELRPLAHTVTAVAPTPPIRLRVVNATDQDVTGVELGDPLFLKVELADESVYGIFGSDLVARSSGGAETVLLINDNGCPVEPSVIQALDRLPGSKSLVAPFQAFKFASDSAVKFQMTVSYCLDTCPPVDCDAPQSSQTQSYGRRRRRRSAASQFLDLMPGDVVVDVTMESPMFLVKPTLDIDHPKFGAGWEQQLLFQDQSEGHIRIRAKRQDYCVPTSALYITGVIVGLLQLAILFACAFLFFGHRPPCDAGFENDSSLSSARSWPSVSSRRKLVGIQS